MGDKNRTSPKRLRIAAIAFFIAAACFFVSAMLQDGDPLRLVAGSVNAIAACAFLLQARRGG